MLAQRRDQLRSFLGIPAAEQSGEDLAAVRALQEGQRHLLVGGPDDAPAGAPGDRRDQPAFFGIGVQQQQRSCGFFAHLSPFEPGALRQKR